MKAPHLTCFLAGLLFCHTAHAQLDTNGNGLSDIWERQHNNGELFTSAFDPQNDSDGDGWTNQQEAAAGTNPFQAVPPHGYIRPEMIHLPAKYGPPNAEGQMELLTPAAVTVRWPTVAGKQYTLEHSGLLLDNSWQQMGTPSLSSGGEMEYNITLTQPDGSTPDKLFWRVKVDDVDSDADGLSNAEEIALGLDVWSAFTVYPYFLPDIWMAEHYATTLLQEGPYTFDTYADSDADGILNYREYLLGTDPNRNVTDGMADNERDTDSDGMPDAWEAATSSIVFDWYAYIYTPKINLDWTINDADGDLDQDGLGNLEEYQQGTAPLNWDTDVDMLPDGWEHQHGLNPLNADNNNGAQGDPDNDGLSNFQEWSYDVNPNLADTDGDGAPDGEEVAQGGNPSDPSDGGNPPDEEDMLEMKIIVGDPSGSQSERWMVEVRDLASNKLILRHAAREFGQLTPDSESVFKQFRKDQSYAFNLVWVATDPGASECDPDGSFFPDYDWALEISYKNEEGEWVDVTSEESNRFVVLDPWDPAANQIAPDNVSLLVNRDELAFPWEGQPDRTTQYQQQIATKQVVLLAPEIAFIGRDPDTGGFHHLGGVVDSSDPRPVVNVNAATATIKNNGSLEIEISGTARDYMSELLAGGEGAVTSMQVFLDGDLIDTIVNLSAANAGVPVLYPWLKRDSTVSFSKKITVPDITPGLHNIVVKSNANALGRQGWHGASILIEKQTYNDVLLENAPAFSVLLSDDLGPARDSLTLQAGETNAVLTEPEGMEASGLFGGQITLNGTARQVQVQLSPTLDLDDGRRDDLSGEIMWQDGAAGMNIIQAIFEETTATSRLFPATSTLATVESWTNLQVTSVIHLPTAPGRGMSPFVVRFQAPDGIRLFGEEGIFKAKRNGEEVDFKEHAGLLGEDPPEGMKWYFLHVGEEPQVFCLNDALAGSIHAPAHVLNDGQVRLEFLLKSNDALVLEDKCTVSNLHDIPEIVIMPPPLAGAALVPTEAEAPAAEEDFTMADVRFWFEILFEDAGKNLLARYEEGNGNDTGLNVSLVKLWAIDNFWASSSLYKFDGLLPLNMSGQTNPKPATLQLNRLKIKSPIDGALALFTALQELRGKNNLWLRTGLETNWITILDAYAAGELADANVEQALRQARLAPIATTVATAKSAYELGFSFVPLGGELIVSVNDIDTALSEGDKSAVAVAVGAILVPEILERTIKYAKRTRRAVKWDLKAEGVMDWTVEELEILYKAGVGKPISRINKMDSLRPYIESGELVLDDSKIRALRSNLRVDPPEPGIDLGISSDNSRAVLIRQLGVDGTLLKQGKEAHHDLPIISSEPDLEIEFLKRGIDPNKAENGRVLDIQTHKLIHGKGTTGWGNLGDPYIYQWDMFFKDRTRPPPNAAAVMQFRDQLRTLTSTPFSSADDLAWPYGKP